MVTSVLLRGTEGGTIAPGRRGGNGRGRRSSRGSKLRSHGLKLASQAKEYEVVTRSWKGQEELPSAEPSETSSNVSLGNLTFNL